MNEIRWTDKVYIDSQGNIRSTDGCPTDQFTQDYINKIITNVGCAKPIEIKENKRMTDQEKFKKLFDELGIEYEENGNTLYIDTFNCDGAREFGISFWDGEYYPKGSFHEFWVVPDKE